MRTTATKRKKIDNLEIGRTLHTEHTKRYHQAPLRKKNNIMTKRQERRVAVPSHTLTAKKTKISGNPDYTVWLPLHIVNNLWVYDKFTA